MSAVPEKSDIEDVLQDKWMTSVDGALVRIDDRVRGLERLIYIAMGGVIVIGGLLAVIGGKILRLLA